MDKTKEEFIVFIRQALNDKESAAAEELYHFLVTCFVRADKGSDGLIHITEFDQLIEEAAAMPRKYGYAPTNEVLYKSVADRKAKRCEMFMKMADNGAIGLDKWIDFATNHIKGKVEWLPKDYLGGSSDDVSKSEFIDFIRKAVDKSTPEYRQLYFFLWKVFQKGDVKRTGTVDPVAFDKMIEAAAAAPRRFGLAPKTEDMFKTDADRLKKRKEYFTKMDTDKNGNISFSEWLEYAYDHIKAKVDKL